MPDTTEQPTTAEFAATVQEMVTDQAPQLFAVVLERDDKSDALIVAWGMSFTEHAYMVKVSGDSQYFLADAENALNYVHRTADATPHLVWAIPEAAASED